MERLRAAGLDAGEVESFEQVQLHQDLESAARCRGVAVDVVTAIGRVQRRFPPRLVRGEIGERHRAAVGLEVAGNVFGDVAFVEAIARGLQRALRASPRV